MSINRAELDICKRRGHKAGLLSDHMWHRCHWCGCWVREVRQIEVQEDAPDKSQQSVFHDLEEKDDK